MGNLIDDENLSDNYRCVDVKDAIIWINLIGVPISFFLLLIGIFRMIFVKKNFTFLTKIIIIIFISEAVQTISKMLQMLKYGFDDDRDNKDLESLDLARGIICQIQIVLAISSDLCSLLSTLLLTLKCYTVIRNKKKFFDNGNNEIYYIIGDIAFPILIAIIFLLIDRARAEGNVSYRFDVRDRCSYWCWLEHATSLGCFGVYVILLVFNIIYACKTYRFLSKGYNKLKEESEFSEGNNISAPLVESGSIIESGTMTPDKKINKITKEEMERIQKTNLARIKSLIYPSVTIIYWFFTAIYRITDDIVMMKYDGYGVIPQEGSEQEKKDFQEYPNFHNAVEFFLVAYTLLSSIRGILYGFAFIAFEEKIFGNVFKKICGCCLKENEFITYDDNNEQTTQRPTEMSFNVNKKEGNDDQTGKDDDECEESED